MRDIRIGIEVGGTFTDWVMTLGDQVVRTGKVLSTPSQPEVGVLNALQQAGGDPGEVSALLHGSTIATNVIVERKGARCALVTTRGFRDVVFIQRQTKSRLFDLRYRQPEALVTRDRVLEVDERIDHSGNVLQSLEINGLLDDVRRLVDEEGLQSIAVSLLHSYSNDIHERAVEDTLNSHFPDLYVTLSSDVLPQFREYERTSTSLMSAYTKPVVDTYLNSLENELKSLGYKCQLSVIQANGGSVPAAAIRHHSVKMVLSGPAAGVIGATAAAQRAGLDNIITFDMGGTSTDVCLVNSGKPRVTTDYKLDGLPLHLPMIDIVTVGAGGGSIAGADRGGILQVGPASAGANPGPACYGLGGRDFTVTDADVVLGYLRPDKFFGGKLTLNVQEAESASLRLGESLRLSPLAAASGVRQFVNFQMAQAMRLVSVDRGYDPRDYTIVAYGGNGPLHAAAVAEELEVEQVLIPVNPGLVSAYGLLIADTQQDFMLTRISPVASVQQEEFKARFRSLADEMHREFANYAIDRSSIELHYSMDMRYAGQAFELTVPVDEFVSGEFSASKLEKRFHEAHRARYGYASLGLSVEAVNYRITGIHPSDLRNIDSAPLDSTQHEPEEGFLMIAGQRLPCLFYDRSALVPGDQVLGPAIIEEPTATAYVPAGWKAQVDAFLNLLMRNEGVRA